MLRALRGRVRYNVPLAPLTWLKVGGPADMLFYPQDIQDLQYFLMHRGSMPYTVLGAGSNVLIRDKGIRGCVIKLDKLTHIHHDGTYLHVGAGILNHHLVSYTLHHQWGGLEFLATIPGRLGGALRMNAGCYGHETADTLVSVQVCDDTGTLHHMKKEDLSYAYRHCGLNPQWIFVQGTFHVHPDTQGRDRVMRYKASRQDTQPQGGGTGGSTFKNPIPHTAWSLLKQSGCQEDRQGGATFSPKHANFFCNTLKTTTAQDFEILGERARQRVQNTYNISLEWEIKRIGEL